MNNGQGPCSDAGRFVRTRITNLSLEQYKPVPSSSLWILFRPRLNRTTGKVARIAFAVSVRRHLLFSRGDQIREYVRAVLAQQDVFIQIRKQDMTRKAEALIRRALDMKDDAQASYYQRSVIMIALLRDLCRRMSEADVDKLVAVAERRAGLCVVGEEAIGPAVDQLTSHVGRWYARSLMTGKAETATHPTDSEDDLAVADAAFELAMTRATGRRLNDEEVGEWAAMLARRISEVAPSDILEIVRGQCGYASVNVHVDRRYAVLVRVASATIALGKTGLFDNEVGEVLVAAEKLARERGFHPATTAG